MISDFELITKFQPFYKAGKSICVTADGFMIADDGQSINYINCENHQLVRTLNKDNELVTCFVANPNDYTVIMANKDMQLKKVDRLYPDKRCKMWNSCHSAPIFAMSLNNLSTRLATGGADNKVRIWHIGENEGNSFSCVYHKSKINILHNHPTQPMVISVSMLDHEIAAWNTDDGKQLGVFAGHQNIVTAVDFHEASGAMISSSRDQTLIVWDCATFTRRLIIPTRESIEACIVWRASPNDIRVMVGGERGIMTLFDALSGVRLQEFTKASLFTNSAVGDDHSDLRAIRMIVATDSYGGIAVVRESDSVEFYSETMAFRHELAGEMSELRDVVVVGEKGDMLLTVESAPYMRLYDCSTMIDATSHCTQWPSQVVAGGHSAEILSVSVFDNGRMVVSGAKDGRVCVWRLDSADVRLKMKLITTLHLPDSIVSCVCSARDGTRIYVHYAMTESLAVLSLTNDCLSKLCDISKPHNDIVSCMDITSDNSLLVTGSKDKLAKIWSYNQKNKQLINKGTLKGHKRGIWSVKFSAMERLLLTSSMDKSIKLWSLDNLECILELQSDSIVYKALFSPDEKQIISCDGNGFVNVWSVEKKCVTRAVSVHDQSVQCLNFLYNATGNFSGFVVAGDSSMIGLYKDVSVQHVEVTRKAKEQQIQHQQELDNLLVQEQFTAAFKLAIKLNKPMVAYSILEKIHRSETVTVTELSPIEMSEETDVSEALRTLDREELDTLLQFATKWLSNIKTCLIGQHVFVFLLCTIPNDELIANHDFVKHLQQNKSHAYKHYRRMKTVSEKVGLFNYIDEISVVRPLDDLNMDTD